MTVTPHVALANRSDLPELRLDEVRAQQPVAIEVPTDVQALKRESPALALAWRLAVRQAFGALFDMGYEARDFQNGAYLLYPAGDAAR